MEVELLALRTKAELSSGSFDSMSVARVSPTADSATELTMLMTPSMPAKVPDASRFEDYGRIEVSCSSRCCGNERLRTWLPVLLLPISK